MSSQNQLEDILEAVLKLMDEKKIDEAVQLITKRPSIEDQRELLIMINIEII